MLPHQYPLTREENAFEEMKTRPANPREIFALLQDVAGFDERCAQTVQVIGEMFPPDLVRSVVADGAGYILDEIVEGTPSNEFAFHAQNVPTAQANGDAFKLSIETAITQQHPGWNVPHQHKQDPNNGRLYTEYVAIQLANVVAPHSPITLYVRFYWEPESMDIQTQYLYTWFDNQGVLWNYHSGILHGDRFICPSTTIEAHYLLGN